MSPAQLATPQWLTDSLEAMHAKYPDDNFEAVIRKNVTSGIYEFRVKCADCPGKVCTPCPALTLNWLAHRWPPPPPSITRLVRERP